MQALRDSQGIYRCIGIPVPNLETTGCDEWLSNRSLICVHTLAAAYYCNEETEFIGHVREQLSTEENNATQVLCP